MSRLALPGGSPTVQTPAADLFKWPIVTPGMEAAVLDVLRAGTMSANDVTRQFEREFADWHGMAYGVATTTARPRRMRPCMRSASAAAGKVEGFWGLSAAR